MSEHNRPSAETLRNAIRFCPDTGKFWRISRRSADCRQRKEIGTPDRYGYLLISVLGRKYLAHQLAWLYVHGAWPASEIDHINGVRDDNRIANLREATREQNMQNQHAPQANNKSGFRGVSWNANSCRWVAQIKASRQRYHLGFYKKAEDASDAYKQAKRLLHNTKKF